MNLLKYIFLYMLLIQNIKAIRVIEINSKNRKEEPINILFIPNNSETIILDLKKTKSLDIKDGEYRVSRAFSTERTFMFLSKECTPIIDLKNDDLIVINLENHEMNFYSKFKEYEYIDNLDVIENLLKNVSQEFPDKGNFLIRNNKAKTMQLYLEILSKNLELCKKIIREFYSEI